MEAADLGRKRCSPRTRGQFRQPGVLFPAFVPGCGRHSKGFSCRVLLAFEPGSACLAGTALGCLHQHLHCTLHVATKPSSSCCQVVFLPRNSRVRLLGAFLLRTAFLGQKVSHFVPFSGMANGQRLKNALQPQPWLLGRSAESKLVWKLLGAMQSRTGTVFFIGERCGVQEVAAAWLTNPTSSVRVGARTSSCRPPSALGARPRGIPSPAGSSGKLVRAALGSNEISRLIWPDSRTSTEASAPVGVARASGGSGAADPQGCPHLVCGR